VAIDVKVLTRTAVLLALTIGFQALGLSQPITGPIVNAVLFVSTGITGGLSGTIIAAVTPWVAYVVGLNKFAPAVPVIMAGNVSLVLVFAALSRVNRYLAAGSAGVVKWLVMTVGIKYLVAQKLKVPAPVVTSLTIMQLWTALGGAVLGLLVMASLRSWERRSRKA
jgi:hypothetical protein